MAVDGFKIIRIARFIKRKGRGGDRVPEIRPYPRPDGV